ncbi:MAG: hypothetical protein ACRDYF_20050 [Acidimicrobiia bacterium]
MSGRGIPFVPAGAVTGIGSLPFTDPDGAVAFVAEHAPRMPFWPQLPNRDVAEGMLSQALALPTALLRRREGTCFEVDVNDLAELKKVLLEAPAGLTEDQAPGFFAFERAARAGAFPVAQVVKGQLTGPATLAWFVAAAGRPVITRPGVVDALTRWVGRRATWQVQRLRALGLPVLVFVDEPALGLIGPLGGAWVAAVLGQVCDAIRLAGGLAGVHCCATPVDFGVLRAARPDVISFDASEPTFAGDEAAVRWWTSSGGMTAFGLVATGPTDSDPGDLFVRWLDAGLRLDDPQGLARRTIVTATCGLGLVDPPAALQSFRRSAQVGTLVREVALSGAAPGPAPRVRR